MYLCVATEGQVSHEPHDHAHQGPCQDRTARDVPTYMEAGTIKLKNIDEYKKAKNNIFFPSPPRIQVSGFLLRGNISLYDTVVFVSTEGINDENQVRSAAWKLAEAHDKEKTMDPMDLRVPVMLKALYSFEVWFRVCFIGPAISTSINTATAIVVVVPLLIT